MHDVSVHNNHEKYLAEQDYVQLKTVSGQVDYSNYTTDENGLSNTHQTYIPENQTHSLCNEDESVYHSPAPPDLVSNQICKERLSDIGETDSLNNKVGAKNPSSRLWQFAVTRRGGGVDGDQVSDMDPSSSDSGAVRCSVLQPIKKKFSLMGKKINKPKREMIDMGRMASPKFHSDPEKEKRRIARKKEKRATLILGLIMGSFIACWLPFFVFYILSPIVNIPFIAFDFAFWLGYMNSAFNPIIYTIFNRDFRRAFRKILFK